MRHRQTYKDFIAIRKASSALAFGGLEWLLQGENHLVYLRDDGKERIISILMRSAAEVHLHESQLENNGFELVLGSTPIKSRWQDHSQVGLSRFFYH